MSQQETLNQKLAGWILSFCRSIAGSSHITAVCMGGTYELQLLEKKTTLEVLLIIRGFQPRLISHLRSWEGKSVVIVAVDEWVFKRDVDRGFLGEALAGLLIFPYTALTNPNYLHAQEIKLKKRLISELLQNLILEFSTMHLDMCIKPEYFMYEAIMSRVRLFPPLIYGFLFFSQEKAWKTSGNTVLQGYLKALKHLEKEKAIIFSDGYVNIAKEFADKIRSRKFQFTSLFRSAQRALFLSVLGIVPRMLDSFSQNRDIYHHFRRTRDLESRIIRQFESPQKYLFVPTARGLVSLAERGDIKTVSRKVLSLANDVPIEISEVGGVLNDVYLVRAGVYGEEKKVVIKRFKDWSSFKWFPLTLWTVGTRAFAVSGKARLERECTINQFLGEKGLHIPRILYVSHRDRLVFMEYVEGENLSKIIKKIATAKSAGERRKHLRLIRRVGRKLAKVHRLGIALGDTKPQNIIIDKHGEIFLMDFEQASRGGDAVWDVAEFLYYMGHDLPPLTNTNIAETVAGEFAKGYLEAGGKAEVVKKASAPKYTKVFSVFTPPLVMLTISNVCRKVDKLKVQAW
ncbi:MAG: AarF/UbiB family protein [Candidatus Bathyarchaeota archaeon]|nr:AarF/UbiB family protein [Candidatus Bathyarchaeota archaeon]